MILNGTLVKVKWDNGSITWIMESEINSVVGKLSPIGYYTEEFIMKPIKKMMMKTLLCETVCFVIHVGEGGPVTTVAMVDVEKSDTDMKKLETFHEDQQHQQWWTNEGITKMFDGKVSNYECR